MDDVSPTTPLISVVIPLYNEGSHLRELLADLKTALQETGCRFELKAASDFKLIDRRVLDTWLAMRERNVFFRGMTAWMGFRTIQIPFEVAPRRGGKSGWSYLRRTKLALIGITTFSSFPLRLVTFAGVIFFLFAVGLGIQT